MTKWLLRCTKCNNEWELEVSFNLLEFGKIYHYCKKCGENSFHEVIEKIE